MPRRITHIPTFPPQRNDIEDLYEQSMLLRPDLPPIRIETTASATYPNTASEMRVTREISEAALRALEEASHRERMERLERQRREMIEMMYARYNHFWTHPRFVHDEMIIDDPMRVVTMDLAELESRVTGRKKKKELFEDGLEDGFEYE